MAILSHVFLFCTDIPLVCLILNISGNTKKNPKSKKLTLLWICDKFIKYSGAIFEMPVIGRQINYVLESDFNEMTPKFKCRQHL